MPDDIRIIHGDCLDVLPTLSGIDAVVADPPYGRRHLSGQRRRADHGRFSGGNRVARRIDHEEIAGDDRPFDPSPFLGFPKAILFGMNHYCDRLPPGSSLVWLKRSPAKVGKFLSDCEIAWMKGGCGVYLYHHVWDGVCRDSEVGEFYHPTQKPVALMRWCIERLKLKSGATILDPYAGSGATLVAAAQMGFKAIGIEVDERYIPIINRRVENAKTPLFQGENA